MERPELPGLHSEVGIINEIIAYRNSMLSS
jgi:hypothetical protein